MYYFIFPLIYLVASSPFWLLYLISDFLYFLMYRVIGYRKRVVIQNLKNAFPEKSDLEIEKLTKDFFRYLCDLILETLKTITWTEKDVLKRVKFNNMALINSLYKQNKSFIIVMGHLGNWEWAGPSFSLHCKHQLYVVYQPLSSSVFEKIIVDSRTKFNTKIIKRKDTLRTMIANRKTLTATALIADQAPTPVETASWLPFLNQETAVFNGPEKIAKKLNLPIVYIGIKRIKRGYYEINPQLLFENSNNTAELEITQTFTKILESEIKLNPETWLWSHKRWKHKKNN